MDDKDLIKEFYKSGASNFAAFKRARLTRAESPTAATRQPAAPTAAVTKIPPPVAAPAATLPVTKTPNVGAPVTKAPPQQAPTPLPSAVQTKKTNAALQPAPQTTVIMTQKKTKDVPAVTSDVSMNGNDTQISSISAVSALSANVARGGGSGAPVKPLLEGDSASNDYMLFLRQQQDLQKCHQKLDELLQQYGRDRVECQSNLNTVQGSAAELLAELEKGTNWNLNSKYNVQTLIQDAKLQLQPRELYQPDDKPQYLDIIQQQGNLEKLRKDHCKRDPFAEFKVLFDNASRRLDRAEKEIKNSQLDAANIARLPDTLFIQLDHVLSSATIEEVLQDTENHLEELTFKLEDTKSKREQAVDDGEMPRAEEFYYDVVRYYEGILELVLDKLRITERTQKESTVFDKVREQYQKKAMDETNTIKNDKETLKKRCENDMRQVFALKERVDAVEAQTKYKMQQEYSQSEQLLTANAARTSDAWSRIKAIEDELISLENERYNEIKRRVASKEKDETRRMEYERFCQVVDRHTSLLDLTVRNCDTAIHVATLLGELVNSGFTGLGTYMKNNDTKYSTMLLDTHNQHLHFFEGLYLTLGELMHKKEKKIQEIDKAIQNAHIQQELAIDTMNPNAKKYSDAKKELLRQRDQVERELRELREKAQTALNNFRVSEEALKTGGVQFVHPVVLQQEQELETRAKMVEYKAIAVGHVDILPIQQELADLKRHINETRQVVESVNFSRMGTLPAIEAP